MYIVHPASVSADSLNRTANQTEQQPTVRDAPHQLKLTTDISTIVINSAHERVTLQHHVSACWLLLDASRPPALTVQTLNISCNQWVHTEASSGELTRCSGGCCSRSWEPSEWWSDAVSVGQTAEAFKAAAVTKSRKGCWSGAAARRRAQRKPFKTFKGSTALCLKQSQHWGFTAAFI